MLRVLAAAAATLTLVALPASAGAAPTYASPEGALLTEINRARAAHGLRPLASDATLARAARAHTRAMTASGVFAHGAFAARMHRFHASGRSLGENLFWGAGPFGTPRAIVHGWLASPEHRANLLHPGFRRIGLGEVRTRFRGAAGATVVTADFAGA